MTTEAKDLVSAPTRRERQRAATYDEIVTVARQLLGSPDALSLRAIAAEMGLTAPALYRYVDSYHELLMLVARAIFEDVISAMTSARDRHGDDDPAAQIVASTAAFRGWALAHPAEFGLIFANPAIAEAVEVLEPADPSSPGWWGPVLGLLHRHLPAPLGPLPVHRADRLRPRTGAAGAAA